MDERVRFIAAWIDNEEGSFAELCRSFGVSRKTGYKWVARYEQLGAKGLEELPRDARTHPLRTTAEVVDAIVKARKQHPFWGPRKLQAWLEEHEPSLELPAHSTISNLLRARGLIRPRRRRLRVPLHGFSELQTVTQPNVTWCADFKGHFALGDRRRCYPLTITDAFSRYLVKCEALHEPREEQVRREFELAFREFGMPLRIRTDNGPPFASLALGGLSRLAMWWIKLGITPERIEPGKPQQNGRHERMHGTLKKEATIPPGATLVEQQRTFDRFRREYNDERPHEALDQRPPARLYALSPRPFPSDLAPPQYPDPFAVRTTQGTGLLFFEGSRIRLGSLFAHEPIGIKPAGNDEYEIFYGPVSLGFLAPRDGKLQLREVARNPGARRRGRPRKSEYRDPVAAPSGAGDGTAQPGSDATALGVDPS
jgi:transposase InsO family protein